MCLAKGIDIIDGGFCCIRIRSVKLPLKQGHVDECLGGFGHGALDKPTGRMMGDTTTLFVLELYEILQHTGDLPFVKKMWPSAKKALDWCMSNANKGGYGLPQYLTTTYDHFGFERHQAVAYNAHVYLTALAAGVKLAEAVADSATAATVSKSIAIAQSAVVDEAKLWNSTDKFFRCHTDTVWQAYTKPGSSSTGGNTFEHAVGFLAAGNDYKPATNATFLACQTTCASSNACLGFSFKSNSPMPSGEILCYTKTAIHLTHVEAAPNQIFTDTLYGQMLSHHFLNGSYTVNTTYLSSHLKYEWEKNQDSYGMRVLSNPVQEDSIWMNGWLSSDPPLSLSASLSLSQLLSLSLFSLLSLSLSFSLSSLLLSLALSCLPPSCSD